MTSSQWRNRIVGSGEKPASDFLANPDNWRIHPKPQQDALSGVLSEVGWVQQVVENVRTGNLIDGHLRVSLALSQGDETPVPYVQVDLSEEEERLVLATLDPLSTMAVTDTAKLDELLREVATGDAALQAMLDQLAQNAGVVPPDVNFKEYDESVADEVEYITCPECGHKWPK